MTATPAWPPQSTPRLFVAQCLDGLAEIQIDGPPAHYLISVMRMKTGAHVKLFDDQSGEWLGEASDVGKRSLTIALRGQLRPREIVPDIWLAAAPIRKARYDWVAEKACELGVDRFIPVLMQRCVADKVKPDRLRAHMIEAAEQCGRTALPKVDEVSKLSAFLKMLEPGRTLFFADEQGGAPAAKACAAHSGPAVIIVGPEGGFTDQERALLVAHSSTVPISLGPRILRADSAAIAALSIWMSVNGDWR